MPKLTYIEKLDQSRCLAEAMNAVSKDVFMPVGTYDRGIRFGRTVATEWVGEYTEEQAVIVLDGLILARKAGLKMAKEVLASYRLEPGLGSDGRQEAECSTK